MGLSDQVVSSTNSDWRTTDAYVYSVCNIHETSHFKGFCGQFVNATGIYAHYVHHGEIRVPFDAWFAHPQGRIALKKLHAKYE